MITDPIFYAFAIPAVIMTGLAKGGFAGIGAIAMPLLALVIAPVQAAAILLPILLVQDAVGVWAFRKSWDRRILAIALPGAAVGILLGYLLAAKVSQSAILGVLGAISIGFALWRLWLGRRGAVERLAKARPRGPRADAALGLSLSVASGFTSQVAHAGQPPFQMWVLPKALPAATFVGTNALYFAALNTLKVPAYFALGELTPGNLATAAVLLPVALVSTFAGVWLVKRVSAQTFYLAIYALMIGVGGLLIWEAFR